MLDEQTYHHLPSSHTPRISSVFPPSPAEVALPPHLSLRRTWGEHDFPSEPPPAPVHCDAAPLDDFCERDDNDEPFRLVALGKCGEGKSGLLNAILGEDAFRAKLSVSVEAHSGRWLGHSAHTAVNCVDTPSFAGQLGDRARIAQIGGLLEQCLGGVDAFLIVIKTSHYRYDATIQATLQVYETILTPSFWNNVVLVFSHADPETASTWVDSQPSLDDFAQQIAKQFRLKNPPPICLASHRRTFGKRSTSYHMIRNLGIRGEIVVNDGAKSVTIEAPALQLYSRIRELHARPYYPAHMALWLGKKPERTTAGFVDELMSKISKLDAFKQVDRAVLRQRRASASRTNAGADRSVYNLGMNPSTASSLTPQNRSYISLGRIPWSRPSPTDDAASEMARSDTGVERRRPVSEQPPQRVGISYGTRIMLSGMVGLLPGFWRSEAASPAPRQSGFGRYNVPHSAAVGVGDGDALA
ncbi:hypothetical protein BC938DRAFT_479840 [Jimgerdemannia flammicorona]|uniref:AIG1-type G domain-containing protein n=1 Tax=Jimgerdemannia flammicorona TaxID=994334 RepID=A0A433QK17_9FUNG|nr:hypothetical protein BC938DRAFT_479840 [Jimgerdemannia flammicorona]